MTGFRSRMYLTVVNKNKNKKKDKKKVPVKGVMTIRYLIRSLQIKGDKKVEKKTRLFSIFDTLNFSYKWRGCLFTHITTQKVLPYLTKQKSSPYSVFIF